MLKDCPPSIVTSPADIARLARPHVRESQEVLVLLCLTSRSAMIGAPHVVSIGTIGSVQVSPRDVYREAMMRNAAKIAIVHNHPSGDPTPSDADLYLTLQMFAAGDLLGIPMVDHVVIAGDDRYQSIAEVLDRSGVLVISG